MKIEWRIEAEEWQLMKAKHLRRDGLFSHVRYSREVNNIILSADIDFGHDIIVCDLMRESQRWSYITGMGGGMKIMREGLAFNRLV